jgi:hypothetical protein
MCIGVEEMLAFSGKGIHGLIFFSALVIPDVYSLLSISLIDSVVLTRRYEITVIPNSDVTNLRLETVQREIDTVVDFGVVARLVYFSQLHDSDSMVLLDVLHGLSMVMKHTSHIITFCCL